MKSITSKPGCYFGLVLAMGCVFLMGLFLHHFFAPDLNEKNPGEYSTVIKTQFLDEGFNQRLKFERLGHELAKSGEYEQAVAAYKSAINPNFIKYKWEQSTAKGNLLDLYQLLGEYDKGLEILNWYKNAQLNNQVESRFYNYRYPELIARKKYDETGDVEYIYKYLKWLKEVYGQFLPPAGFDPVFLSRAYLMMDYVGGYDEGVVFVNETIRWLENNNDDIGAMVNPPTTVAAADKCMVENHIRPGKVHPRWDLCRHLREFLVVKEAFEESKAGMPKICGDGGKTCIGRATHAIIQSDYFPW